MTEEAEWEKRIREYLKQEKAEWEKSLEEFLKEEKAEWEKGIEEVLRDPPAPPAEDRKKSGGGWEEELADLVEIARKESLEEFLNNIRFTRTRPYSRISAICREEYITLEDVCSKGPGEPRYSEIGMLYSYAKPWCGKKEVTIYRGGSEIKPGDWVALEREYAEGHGTPVYELKVPLSDVVWAGTYEKEWFYVPKRLQGLFKSPEEFWRACRSEQKPKSWEEAKKRYERWKV